MQSSVIILNCLVLQVEGKQVSKPERISMTIRLFCLARLLSHLKPYTGFGVSGHGTRENNLFKFAKPGNNFCH
jgi:hypothetical protein